MTDICRDCGLCCNGGIFRYLDLTAEDRARLQEADRSAPERITQPCSFWHGECTVYEHRPAGCRRFECDTLASLRQGGIDHGEALRRIGIAISLQAKLVETLPDEQDRRDVLHRWMAAPPEERVAAAGTALADLLAFQIYIDRHFYRAARGEGLSPR